MIQVVANACETLVIGIDLIAIKEKMIDGETALLAHVVQEIRIGEAVVIGRLRPPRCTCMPRTVCNIAQHGSLTARAEHRNEVNRMRRIRPINRTPLDWYVMCK
jgi:hypothetical protein